VSAVMTEHPDMSPMTEACTPGARPAAIKLRQGAPFAGELGGLSKNWPNITAMGRKAAQNN